MRISAIFAALLCSLACLGQSSPASDPTVTIYAKWFQAPPDDAVSASLQAELAGIFAPSGVRFDWRPLDDPRASIEPVAELVVVKFRGDCSTEPPPTFGKVESGALGATHVTNGEILPFIDIHCECLHGLLRPQLRYFGGDEKSRALGIAMARVLAHELYHVFASTAKHGRGGVAQAYYTAFELLSDSFQFTDHDFRLIRKGRLPVLDAGGGD